MTKTPEQAVIQAAFWKRVDRRGDDECWPWTGGKSAHGYGRLWHAGKTRVATRISWEIANGQEFPEGRLACHSCDNPECVNPRHIWPGTQSENLKDCVAKGRHLSRPQSHCEKGHAMVGGNLMRHGVGFRCRECRRALTRDAMRRMRARQKESRNG